MKIVVLDGGIANPGDLSWEALGRLGELTVYDESDLTDEEQTVSRLEGAQIAITNKTLITRQVIDRCPDLKYIALLSTGYNVVDYVYAGEKGIPVSNVPAYGTAAVAQFTIALLLEICHRIGHHDRSVHDGVWEKCGQWCYWDYPLIELAGKTMGIIGFGRIGRATGQIARALGMKVLACGSRPTPEGEEIGTYTDLDTVLSRSDVISLHCPLFPETERLINRENIEKMKDGAILLNTGRGGLLDEAAVAQALNSGKLAAAGVDVVSAEPIRGDNPLLGAKNCMITPHIAWASKEARQRILDCVADNVTAFQKGAPVNVVNGVCSAEPGLSVQDRGVLEKMAALCGQITGKLEEHPQPDRAFLEHYPLQTALCSALIDLARLGGELSEDIPVQSLPFSWEVAEKVRDAYAIYCDPDDLGEVWDVLRCDIPMLNNFCQQLLN